MQLLSFLFDKHLDKTVLAIAVALAIALLSLGAQSRVEKARAITSFLLYPVERVTGRFASVEALKEENGELRAMVATLYQERERLLEFGRERNRLRTLLDLKADSFYRFLPCEIIARSSTSFFRSIMVDRGTADSVRVGMAVVGYRGLVGRVSQVFPTSSQVVLINNKSISVSCMNRRNRVVGMLEWDRGSFFRLEYVGKEEDIVIGDTLVTSGLGMLFPKGFPVGAV
ncbi:MAG: rod shape-determining protein MreC, partial [Candidatus Krumholzibacteriia bacterium]